MSIWQIERKFKFAAIPAEYTPEDPYDLAGKQPLFDSLQTNWSELDPDQQRQAIANAFRSTMISPQLELKWNAVAYQALMGVPAEESDPDVYENYLRDWKRKYDNPGQTDLLNPNWEGFGQDEVLPGSRMNPPFWKNVRGLSVLAPYIETLRQAALQDLASGGKGYHFRQVAVQIPGIGPKVASFAWLILQPKTSDLAAIDLWMMRHLGLNAESPNNDQYYILEDRLREERDRLYPGVPLGQYQWAVWDSLRTPGEHQDHSPFRVVDPPNFRDVDWSGPGAVERAQQKRFTPAPVNPDQMSLMEAKTGWSLIRKSNWQLIRTSAAYSIQGKIVAGAPNLSAEGVVVRPDRQDRAVIEGILENLYTHNEDVRRQRELIPEWALNRGGKVSGSPDAGFEDWVCSNCGAQGRDNVYEDPEGGYECRQCGNPKVAADFRPGPGGQGYTYGASVIAVSSWVDVNDNWLLEHPACRGIIAERGGAASHGVVVARQRNIPVVVDVPDAKNISPGDYVQVDSSTGLINVNGGTTEEFDEAQVADVPILRFVWSQGKGMTASVPPDDPESGTLHMNMMMQMNQQGQWNQRDSALGVIYQDGLVQMMGNPTDKEEMVAWLNEQHPVTKIDEDFSM